MSRAQDEAAVLAEKIINAIRNSYQAFLSEEKPGHQPAVIVEAILLLAFRAAEQRGERAGLEKAARWHDTKEYEHRESRERAISRGLSDTANMFAILANEHKGAAIEFREERALFPSPEAPRQEKS